MVTPSGGVDMDTGLRDVVGATFYIKGSVSGKPENDHFLLYKILQIHTLEIWKKLR